MENNDCMIGSFNSPVHSLPLESSPTPLSFVRGTRPLKLDFPKESSPTPLKLHNTSNSSRHLYLTRSKLKQLKELQSTKCPVHGQFVHRKQLSGKISIHDNKKIARGFKKFFYTPELKKSNPLSPEVCKTRQVSQRMTRARRKLLELQDEEKPTTSNKTPRSRSKSKPAVARVRPVTRSQRFRVVKPNQSSDFVYFPILQSPSMRRRPKSASKTRKVEEKMTRKNNGFIQKIRNFASNIKSTIGKKDTQKTGEPIDISNSSHVQNASDVQWVELNSSKPSTNQDIYRYTGTTEEDLNATLQPVSCFGRHKVTITKSTRGKHTRQKRVPTPYKRKLAKEIKKIGTPIKPRNLLILPTSKPPEIPPNIAMKPTDSGTLACQITKPQIYTQYLQPPQKPNRYTLSCVNQKLPQVNDQGAKTGTMTSPPPILGTSTCTTEKLTSVKTSQSNKLTTQPVGSTTFATMRRPVSDSDAIKQRTLSEMSTNPKPRYMMEVATKKVTTVVTTQRLISTGVKKYVTQPTSVKDTSLATQIRQQTNPPLQMNPKRIPMTHTDVHMTGEPIVRKIINTGKNIARTHGVYYSSTPVKSISSVLTHASKTATSSSMPDRLTETVTKSWRNSVTTQQKVWMPCQSSSSTETGESDHTIFRESTPAIIPSTVQSDHVTKVVGISPAPAMTKETKVRETPKKAQKIMEHMEVQTSPVKVNIANRHGTPMMAQKIIDHTNTITTPDAIEIITGQDKVIQKNIEHAKTTPIAKEQDLPRREQKTLNHARTPTSEEDKTKRQEIPSEEHVRIQTSPLTVKMAEGQNTHKVVQINVQHAKTQTTPVTSKVTIRHDIPRTVHRTLEDAKTQTSPMIVNMSRGQAVQKTKQHAKTQTTPGTENATEEQDVNKAGGHAHASSAVKVDKSSEIPVVEQRITDIGEVQRSSTEVNVTRSQVIPMSGQRTNKGLNTMAATTLQSAQTVPSSAPSPVLLNSVQQSCSSDGVEQAKFVKSSGKASMPMMKMGVKSTMTYKHIGAYQDHNQTLGFYQLPGIYPISYQTVHLQPIQQAGMQQMPLYVDSNLQKQVPQYLGWNQSFLLTYNAKQFTPYRTNIKTNYRNNSAQQQQQSRDMILRTKQPVYNTCDPVLTQTTYGTNTSSDYTYLGNIGQTLVNRNTVPKPMDLSVDIQKVFDISNSKSTTSIVCEPVFKSANTGNKTSQCMYDTSSKESRMNDSVASNSLPQLTESDLAELSLLENKSYKPVSSLLNLTPVPENLPDVIFDSVVQEWDSSTNHGQTVQNQDKRNGSDDAKEKDMASSINSKIDNMSQNQSNRSKLCLTIPSISQHKEFLEDKLDHDLRLSSSVSSSNLDSSSIILDSSTSSDDTSRKRLFQVTNTSSIIEPSTKRQKLEDRLIPLPNIPDSGSTKETRLPSSDSYDKLYSVKPAWTKDCGLCHQVEKVLKIRPYYLKGNTSVRYLKHLLRITDYTNMDDVVTSVDKFLESIELNSPAKPHLLARDILWRIFTIGDLYGKRVNTLDSVVMDIVKEKVMAFTKCSEDVWQGKCVPFMNTSIWRLFNHKMKQASIRAVLNHKCQM